ncbi:AAA family ATPase [Hysterangium stoloniferum]|nr:AAA family ATPase [Hysterangium stoloniferum]
MVLLSSKTFKVALADTSSSTPRVARRVIINHEILKACKVAAGDVVRVVSTEPPENGITAPFAIGIAWPSLELDQTTVRISPHVLTTTRLVEGAQVQVVSIPSGERGSAPGVLTLRDIREAQTIRLQEIAHPHGALVPQKLKAKQKEVEGSKRRHWLALYLREQLVDLKYMTPFQVVDVTYEGVQRRFAFKAVDSCQSLEANLADGISKLSIGEGGSAPQAWSVGWNTTVSLDDEPPAPITAPLAYSSVGGLDLQISQIRDLIEIPLTRPDLFHHFGLKPPRGILLYGPPGTGKTHLARAVAASTHASTLAISGPSLASAYHGETEGKLREVFREAREKSPCVVIIDEVDALCPRREDGAGGEVEKRVVATLLTEMDGVAEQHGDARVIVVATTNRPNAIDPALRRPGRFDREIEIGIPDAPARLAILKVLLAKTPHSLPPADLESLASRTHGYVGADLGAVVRDAGTIAIKRHLSLHPSSNSESAPECTATTLTLSDLLAALPAIRPSALREVFLETPQVLWSDIGGQAVVKQKLKECVEWPLLHRAAFERLGVKPPRGVLLYGPPGCSKTLTAKALATESGINFIAVKGPELLNKFVGESERAVREIFRKARASSPSIVFFDEIDALATSRMGSEGTGSHEGVLTSLLNEMDGIQELSGVTVVAATNRPDVLDSALMRPGRLDRVLYVGPPDRSGREDILRIRTAKMAVDPELDLGELADLTDGCSGAEIAALCQDAALLTMHRDMDSPFVTRGDFVVAAQNVRRQITPEMIRHFTSWRERSGLRSA